MLGNSLTEILQGSPEEEHGNDVHPDSLSAKETTPLTGGIAVPRLIKRLT